VEEIIVLNQRHMLFAWLSLVWVAFTDFYVYLCRPRHPRFQ